MLWAGVRVIPNQEIRYGEVIAALHRTRAHALTSTGYAKTRRIGTNCIPVTINSIKSVMPSRRDGDDASANCELDHPRISLLRYSCIKSTGGECEGLSGEGVNRYPENEDGEQDSFPHTKSFHGRLPPTGLTSREAFTILGEAYLAVSVGFY